MVGPNSVAWLKPSKGEAQQQPAQPSPLRTFNNKSLWPFKKSPKSFCGFGGCGPPSIRSSSPALLNLTPSKSPQQYRKQDEYTPSPDFDEKQESPNTSTPGELRVSLMGPEPPPKDTEWRRTRQQRRQGGLMQLERPLPCTPAPSQDSHSCYSSPPDTSSTEGDRVETSGLERLASFLRFHRPANGQQNLPPSENQEGPKPPVRHQRSESASSNASTASNGTLQIRSFAASRSSSLSYSRPPPPIFIPKPKVTLTAADEDTQEQLAPRPASVEPHSQPAIEAISPRHSAPAGIYTASIRSTPRENDASGFLSEQAQSSTSAVTSIAEAEIAAAERVSMEPARILSTLALTDDIRDDIRSAMESSLPAPSPVHSTHTAACSPSDENFPSGPLSAKSAVYIRKQRSVKANAPRFDLDTILCSPGNKSGQQHEDQTEVAAEHAQNSDVSERPEEEALQPRNSSSSVGTSASCDSLRSTAATSLVSTGSLRLGELFPLRPNARNVSEDNDQHSLIEELEPSALPAFGGELPLTPKLPFRQSPVSQLSADNLDKEDRKHVLESMRTLVAEDPRILQGGNMDQIESDLKDAELRVPELRDRYNASLRHQRTLLTEASGLSGHALALKQQALAASSEELVKVSHELFAALGERSLLRNVRMEHLAASATLSLSRLNSSFVLCKDKLSAAQQTSESLNLQRASADLRIQQLKGKLKSKDSEERRLRTLHQQLAEQSLSRRPSDAEVLQADPAIANARRDTLHDELTRALQGHSQETSGCSPLAESMQIKLPLRSISVDRLAQLNRGSSEAPYCFPPQKKLNQTTQIEDAPVCSQSHEAEADMSRPSRTPRTPRTNSMASLGPDFFRLKALEEMLDVSMDSPGPSAHP